MRREHLGEGWERAKVRGTPLNTGDMLRAALEAGAAPYGDWSTCHSVAWDAGASDEGDRELTNQLTRGGYPLGIVVNAEGRRFLDEGADFRNYTYAKYGARDPDPARRRRVPAVRRDHAAAAADRGVRLPRHHASPQARVAGEAGRDLGIDGSALVKTVAGVQRLDRRDRAVRPGGQGRPARGRRPAEEPTGRSRWRARRSTRSRSPAGSRSPSVGCMPTPTAGRCRRRVRRSTGCSSVERCSAGSSVATTLAGPASSREPSSAAGPGRSPRNEKESGHGGEGRCLRHLRRPARRHPDGRAGVR